MPSTPSFPRTAGTPWRRLLEELQPVVPTAPRAVRSHRSAPGHDLWTREDRWQLRLRGVSASSAVSTGLSAEIVDACRALSHAAERTGLRVNFKTGTHVHLGWTPNVEALRRLYVLAAYYEPALMLAGVPIARRHDLRACIRAKLRSIRALRTTAQWEHFVAQDDARYLAVNARNLFGGYGTLEVRLHMARSTR